MIVKAVIVNRGQGIEVPLSDDDQDTLARIFELGVNVRPMTPQQIRVMISTPGYEEEA